MAAAPASGREEGNIHEQGPQSLLWFSGSIVSCFLRGSDHQLGLDCLTESRDQDDPSKAFSECEFGTQLQKLGSK